MRGMGGKAKHRGVDISNGDIGVVCNQKFFVRLEGLLMVWGYTAIYRQGRANFMSKIAMNTKLLIGTVTLAKFQHRFFKCVETNEDQHCQSADYCPCPCFSFAMGREDV
jgi:hypothetical protein